MPWISKEELWILKENLKDYRENVRHLNEKLVCEYTEKDKLIENAADLLGYESKRKTRKERRFVQSPYPSGGSNAINRQLQNYSYYALGQSNVPLRNHEVEFDEVESKTEFFKRLISEHKEKQRLITLADEVEKGKKLKRESK